jgi:hypothetical protein
MIFRRLCFAFVTSLLSLGCYIHGGVVRGVNPQPQLHLAPRGESLTLVLAPDIPSDFKVDQEFIVKDLRGTLSRGFVAGFGPSFPNLDLRGLDHPELVLELTDVTIWFDDVDHVSTKYVAYDRYKVRIRYHARLLDREGRPLGSAAGTVASRETSSDGQYVYGDAIEAMYEEIGDKLFWK